MVGLYEIQRQNNSEFFFVFVLVIGKDRRFHAVLFATVSSAATSDLYHPKHQPVQQVVVKHTADTPIIAEASSFEMLYTVPCD